jgi:hypothetical protein
MAEGTIMEYLLSQVRVSEGALIGGTAYFYAIGGTTPKAAYSDMAATSAIYSVVLDADARAEVYGTGKYRIVIKDVDGVTQTDDDVNFWGGASYVVSPATNTDHYVPKWAGTNSGTLEDGFSVVTTVGVTGSDSSLPTEQAVREAITGIVSSATTSVEGVAKLASNAVGLAGTNNTDIITPSVLDYVIDNTPHVLQVVNYSSGAVANISATIPIDNTIPQNTEGTEWATLAITPKSATSKLIIDVIVNGGITGGSDAVIALFQDTTVGALNAMSGNADYYTGYGRVILVLKHFMVSGTTSATTFKVRVGGAINVNGAKTGSAGLFGGVNISSITITEVLV